MGLLEIHENLWQAKAVETTTAETLFSATLSRKPSLKYYYIHLAEHKNIYIYIYIYLFSQAEVRAVTKIIPSDREPPMQEKTPRICPLRICKSEHQPELR